MHINPTDLIIASGIGDDIATLLEKACEAHIDTGRTASVTLKIAVKLDKESGVAKARGRVQAQLPTGDDDAITKKMPSIPLLTLNADYPGQQKISSDS